MGKNRVIQIILSVICILYMGYINVLNCLVFVRDKMFIYILPVAIFIVFITLLSHIPKVNSACFAVIIFGSAFFLKTVIAVYFNTPPTSDFEKIYDAALKAVNGDFSFSKDRYFSTWAYQTGIVAYYALMMKLFGVHLLRLKILNCFFIAGLNVIIYLISRMITGEKNARFIALLYMAYPSTFFLSSVLTNQHLSNLLILTGVYIFFNRQRIPKAGTFLSAVFIAFGNAMRPQAVVVIAAIVLFSVTEIIKTKKINTKMVIPVSVFLLTYVIVFNSLSLITCITGLNKNGLKNTFPLYKFVVGLNNKTYGCYSTEDAGWLLNIKDTGLRNEEAVKLIKQRISDPEELVNTILKKQDLMWARKDDTVIWGFGYLGNDGLKLLGRKITYDRFLEIAQKTEKVFYIFILFTATLGIAAGNKKIICFKEYNIILYIIIINFLCYSLIEIQTRYRDFQMVFLFILAAAGLELFQKYIFNFGKKKSSSQVILDKN